MAYGTINVPGMSGSDLEAVRKLLEEASPFLILDPAKHAPPALLRWDSLGSIGGGLGIRGGRRDTVSRVGKGCEREDVDGRAV